MVSKAVPAQGMQYSSCGDCWISVHFAMTKSDGGGVHKIAADYLVHVYVGPSGRQGGVVTIVTSFGFG